MNESNIRNAFREEEMSFDDYWVFSERDTRKEAVKRTVSIKFKSITKQDRFFIPVMLYEPENTNRNILLYFHGGGWVRGSIESHDCVCRKIANALNVKVLSVEYRLAPQYKFPIALHDVLSVYCGLLDKRNMDFDEIILSGDSAGGNLCAALCMKLKEAQFSQYPMAQILFYPVLSNDFDSPSFTKFGHEPSLTKSMMLKFIDMYTKKDPADDVFVNNKFLYPVLEKDMSLFPKTLIVSAEKDVLLDGQFLFASKLNQAHVDVHHLVIEEAKHGFMTYGEKHWEYASIALDKIKKLGYVL
ncbi:MAG: alpha/beta hydrolase [Holosporales bacterium]|nr:alpha/beta hydrolase [Holosporales bacterium]